MSKYIDMLKAEKKLNFKGGIIMFLCPVVNFRGIPFEDVIQDEDGHVWSQICQQCVDKYKIQNNILDEAGIGLCGVLDCENETDYYIDFPDEEIKRNF